MITPKTFWLWFGGVGLALRRNHPLALASLTACGVLFFTLPAGSDTTMKGAGTCREKNCPCTEEQLKRGMVTTEAGCCNKPKLEGLRGRLRALKEAADLHRKDYVQSVNQRNEARDQLWGKGEGLSFDSGSIVDFGKASASVLASFEGVGETVNWINNGVSIATNISSSEEWAGAGLDFFDSELFKSMELIRSSERANALAWTIYRNRNYPGMREVYQKEFSNMPKGTLSLEGVQTTAKFLGAVQALYDLANATEEVSADLSNWLLANKEATGLQKELNKIDTEIDTVLKQIAKLLEACAGVASGAVPSSSFTPLIPSRQMARVADMRCSSDEFRERASLVSVNVRSNRDLTRVASASDSLNEQDVRRLEVALGNLKTLRRDIARIQKRFEDQLFPLFSPWLIGTSKQVAPAMLVELARMAKSDVKAMSKVMELVIKQAESIHRDLEAIRPRRTT